ncbi:hypothetical protein B0H10DRAFT_2032755, partial [Mycena sp. CBHHK59/15]
MHMPQELTDLIVQYVTVDSDATPARSSESASTDRFFTVGVLEYPKPDYSVLKHCSLVSHSFLRASQRNLFPHIQLFPHSDPGSRIPTLETF